MTARDDIRRRHRGPKVHCNAFYDKVLRETRWFPSGAKGCRFESCRGRFQEES